MPLTHPALVLAKGDIEHPMHTVFDPPVSAHRIAEGRRIAREAPEVGAGLARALRADLAFGDDHADAAQVRPRAMRIEIGHHRRVVDRPDLPDLEAAMPLLHRAPR